MRFTLQSNTETLILTNPPIGWREFSSEYTFDEKTFGYSVKTNAGSGGLKFVLEAMDFLKREVDEFGYRADVTFIVEKQNDDYSYDITFIGKLDFIGGFTCERDYFEVGIYEGGLKKVYSEKRGVNYEIPLDTDIFVPQGIQLIEEVIWNCDKGTLPGNFGVFTDSRVSLAMKVDNNSKIYTNNLIFTSQEATDPTAPYYTTPFLTARRTDEPTQPLQNIVMNVKASLKMGDATLIDYTKPSYIKLVTFDGLAEKILYEKMYDSNYFFTNPNADLDFSFVIDMTYTLGNAKTYYLVYDYIRTPVKLAYNPYFRGQVRISYVGLINTGVFDFKAISVNSLGSQLLNRFYNGTFEAKALAQLEQDDFKLFITSGDAVRGIPNAKVKTNFNAFLESLYAIMDCGMVLKENGIIIDTKSKVWDRNNQVIDLGEVSNFKVAQLIYNEWIYNSISVGYERQDYDYANGRQEFAHTLEFTNDIGVPTNKLELVSRYRGDYTGIHLLRYAYVKSNKKDSKSDNNVFFVLAKWQNGRYEAVSGGITQSGLVAGGYFNLGISPHRNLRRQMPYLRSIMYKQPQVLQYVMSQESESNMTTTYNGETIIEKSNENISSGDLLFKPFLYKFDCIVEKDLSQIFGDSPLGYIRFKYRGIEMKGFPISIKGSVEDSTQSIECVAHPLSETDLAKIFACWEDTINGEITNLILGSMDDMDIETQNGLLIDLNT